MEIPEVPSTNLIKKACRMHACILISVLFSIGLLQKVLNADFPQ